MSRIIIEPHHLVACLCEGKTERTLINLLLKDDALLFNSDSLLDGKLHANVNMRLFTQRYLQLNYPEQKLLMLLIQDKKRWVDPGKAYRHKYDGPIHCVTSPEIEMLMIISEGLYEDFKKTRNMKPSIFLANHWKYKSAKIKNKKFVEDFYSVHSLTDALLAYKRICKIERSANYLADLLK